MADAVGLRDVREMIEDDLRGHPLEDRHDLHDLGGWRVDLAVPSHVVDALRERLDHLGRRRARLGQVEPDPAHPEPCKRLSSSVDPLSSTTATIRALGPNAASASRW